MRPILPLHPFVVHQAYVGLVDQGGRLEAVVRTLTAHVAMGQAAELCIDGRRQLAEGELVAVAPGAEELTDVVQSDPLKFCARSSLDCIRSENPTDIAP